MVTKFTINSNISLKKSVNGYYNLLYTGYKKLDNPDFLNTLKNTYNNTSIQALTDGKTKVVNILVEDIPAVMRDNNLRACTCICIPRSKALGTYTNTQLFFTDAVSSASLKIRGVLDGSDIIQRHTNTFTTHFAQTSNPSRMAKTGSTTELISGNDGKKPYSGITKDTCIIDVNRIRGNDIILVDDIYTSGVNIDEDCIQALFDAGANSVVFYAIAYTGRK